MVGGSSNGSKLDGLASAMKAFSCRVCRACPPSGWYSRAANMPTCAPGWQKYPLPLGGQKQRTSFSEAFPRAGGCATQVRDFNQHPRPGFRAQTAQAATICTVLRNLQKRKLQKRAQVSARRRTEGSIKNRQVQAMRMKGPASASVSGRLLARQPPVQDGAQHLLGQPPRK